MIARTTSGRSFKGAALYVLHDKGKSKTSDRVAFVETGVVSGRGQDDTLSVFSMPPDDVCDGVFRDTEVTGDPSV